MNLKKEKHEQSTDTTKQNLEGFQSFLYQNLKN